MTSLLVAAAIELTKLWTRMYTCGLPADQQQARRDEIDSDLWESRRDLASSGSPCRSVAAHIVLRLVLGFPHDVAWRCEQLAVDRPLWLMRAAVNLVFIGGVTTFAVSASSPALNLAKNLQIDVVSSGWIDVGLVDGRAKVVPAVSFTLKNLSDRTLGTLQVNAVFYRLADKDGWGTAFLTAAGSRGLPPGATLPALTLKGEYGYMAIDPDVLRGPTLPRYLLDETKVRVFAKGESNPWTLLGEYSIAHLLLER